MADPISLASGLLALATFAFQSSIALYNTVQSFHFHPKVVRDLTDEVKALSEVLHSLTDTVSSATDVDLTALELPLRRCGNACKDFEQEILKCSSHSGSNRTSFRDWARLRYMGDNIDGFKQLLATYKSTINIALTDASLRKFAITADRIESYRGLLKTATDDLEDHLQIIDGKIDAILGRTLPASESDPSQLDLIKEERLSTQKCLQVCAQLAEHIDRIQPIGPQQGGSGLRQSTPERLTNEGLQECKKNLNLTASRLEQHMEELIERFMHKSTTAMTMEENIADLSRLRDTWQTARKCRDICSVASTHLVENISIIDNFATGDDTVQLLVSTEGKIIHGKNRGYGKGTRQFGGYINDESFRQLSRDFSILGSSELDGDSRSRRGNMSSVPDNGIRDETSPGFMKRYGQGFTLPPKPTPE